MRRMDGLKMEIEQRTVDTVEEIKALLNEKFPDDKEKKKWKRFKIISSMIG